MVEVAGLERAVDRSWGRRVCRRRRIAARVGNVTHEGRAEGTRAVSIVSYGSDSDRGRQTFARRRADGRWKAEVKVKLRVNLNLLLRQPTTQRASPGV